MFTLTIKYWIFIQSKWVKHYFFLYFIPELFHYETAYSVKNVVALFLPNSFLLSPGFHSSLFLHFICRFEWQVGLEMLTVSQMLSFFMIFFGSIKMKATIVHILQPTPNVSEVKEPFHSIFCWPWVVLIALL